VAALAAEGRSDVEQVVLWDPAVRGVDYLAEVLEERTDSVGNTRHTRLDDGTVGVMGFPITAGLRAGLETLDLGTVGAPQGSGRLVVASHAREEYERLGKASFAGAKVRYELVPSEGSWNEVDDYGGALIPVFLIQAIVAHLTQEVR
jgi:hypothetical protein